MDQGLSGIPWVLAEPGSAGIVGHLFLGNRPLAVGGKFPNGDTDKVLWQFPHPVKDLRLTATNLWKKQQPPITIASVGAANTSTDFSNQWPSNIAVPKAGCWRVALSATEEDGHPVKGSVAFIVVK